MLFQKGIILEQHKEPAFSKKICKFVNSDSKKYFEDWKKEEKLTIENLAECARKACIIDESDGVDLYKKILSIKSKGYYSVVADAIDDEPYVSSQMGVAYWLSDEMIGGLSLLEEVSGCKRKYIAVYGNIGYTDIKIPEEINGVAVKKISGRYPAEQRAKKRLRYRNALVVGSGALVHLYRAYTEKLCQTTTFITVGGDCITDSMNIEVSLGMSVEQVLERCGLKNKPNRVCIKGTMTGVGIIDIEENLITPTTASIMAFREKYKNNNYVCIGCGRCTASCPMGLSPYYIYKFIKNNQQDKLDMFDATSCIGCGICSYNCPAKLELSSVIFDYVLENKKTEIFENKAEKVIIEEECRNEADNENGKKSSKNNITKITEKLNKKSDLSQKPTTDKLKNKKKKNKRGNTY